MPTGRVAGLGTGALVPDPRVAIGERWTALARAASTGPTGQTGTPTVKVQINSERCQGHGRCYDLAPGLFGDDDEGYGMVLGDGAVPPDAGHDARLAASNCPERAIEVLEET